MLDLNFLKYQFVGRTHLQQENNTPSHIKKLMQLYSKFEQPNLESLPLINKTQKTEADINISPKKYKFQTENIYNINRKARYNKSVSDHPEIYIKIIYKKIDESCLMKNSIEKQLQYLKSINLSEKVHSEQHIRLEKQLQKINDQINQYYQELNSHKQISTKFFNEDKNDSNKFTLTLLVKDQQYQYKQDSIEYQIIEKNIDNSMKRQVYGKKVKKFNYHPEGIPASLIEPLHSSIVYKIPKNKTQGEDISENVDSNKKLDENSYQKTRGIEIPDIKYQLQKLRQKKIQTTIQWAKKVKVNNKKTIVRFKVSFAAVLFVFRLIRSAKLSHRFVSQESKYFQNNNLSFFITQTQSQVSKFVDCLIKFPPNNIYQACQILSTLYEEQLPKISILQQKYMTVMCDIHQYPLNSILSIRSIKTAPFSQYFNNLSERNDMYIKNVIIDIWWGIIVEKVLDNLSQDHMLIYLILFIKVAYLYVNNEDIDIEESRTIQQFLGVLSGNYTKWVKVKEHKEKVIEIQNDFGKINLAALVKGFSQWINKIKLGLFGNQNQEI